MYNEIIKNYVNMNLSFNLYNPLEIYTLFIRLLNDGYLSRLFFSYCQFDSVLYNINPLGIDIICGNGMCRHISAMLKDIYDYINIENEIITTYYFNKSDIFRFRRQFGNHVINIASYDDFVFYLDPTNFFVWEKIDKYYLFKLNGKEVHEALISSYFDNFMYNNMDINSLKKIKRMLELSQTSSFYNMEIIEKVNNIYNNNMDVFFNFKKENKKYYNDIYNALKKVK